MNLQAELSLPRKTLKGIAFQRFLGSLLYHTKNYQGTTTWDKIELEADGLYHTKNYQGTTTSAE